MLLAACYDQSTAENLFQRWRRPAAEAAVLHLAVEVGPGRGHRGHRGRDRAVRVVRVGLVRLALALPGDCRRLGCRGVATAAGGGGRRWRIARNTRVLEPQHEAAPPDADELSRRRRSSASRCPPGQRTDDRYELLAKLQGVLRSMHFDGILVLVDRVDEPYLINGATDLMRALVWPMLDNKFLKHPGLGLKLLLPSELERLLDRESRDFHQRARLDKQNLIRSLAWTGQSLYDMANARIAACAADGQTPKLADLFEDVDQRPPDRGLWLRCACRGTCSSSCTGCLRRTATPIPTSSRSGRFPAPRSSRCWPSTAKTSTPLTRGTGRDERMDNGLRGIDGRDRIVYGWLKANRRRSEDRCLGVYDVGATRPIPEAGRAPRRAGSRVGGAHDWVTKVYPKKLRDVDNQIYQVPALVLQKGPLRVLLDPVAYDVPGAEGVVDLYLMPTYDDLASLYFEDGAWRIHYAFPPEAMETHSVVEAEALPLGEENVNKVLDSIVAHAEPSF